MAGPYFDAASAKFPFLVRDHHDPLQERALRDHVGIVHLESHHLQFLLDVARENELEPIEVFGEELKPIATIYIGRDFLAQVRHVTDPALPADETGEV